MNIIPRVVAVVIVLLMISVPCVAEVHKVSSDDIMDAALDMKRAAELADKLAPDGARYCRWGISSLDASDLEVAISRFLLNHGTRVPDYVPASNMWHVSSVVDNMVHQLAMGMTQCDLDLRFSGNARSVAVSSSSILNKMTTAREKFDLLAYQQTQWQEESNSRSQSEAYNHSFSDTGQVMSSKVLSAARGLEQAVEVAAKVTNVVAKTKGCRHTDVGPPEVVYLTKLLDYLEHAPHLPGYVPASNMWGVRYEALTAQLVILTTLESCTYYASEKKQARNEATEALQAYHELTATIATFDSLALQQTEWEEQNAQRQAAIQEQ